MLCTKGRDTKMAWPLLCTYLRGGPRNWNPYYPIRMLHAMRRVHSIIRIVRGLTPLGFLSASYIELFQNDFLGPFGKCEIIS